MDCKTAIPLLHAYLDDELDRAAVGDLESHLESCRDCAHEFAALEALRKAVQQGAPRHAAPPGLRARLRAIEESPGKQTQAPGRTGPRWLALAASVAFAFALGAGSMTWHGTRAAKISAQQALLHDLLASHLRALAAASPVDVISSNRHTVKPWFAGRIGLSPPVLDFSAEGFPLVGGRIDYIGEQRVAVLAYSHGEHLIDVYLLPPGNGDVAQAPIQVRGYRLAAIRLQDQPAWIVADVDDHEFRRFTGLLASRNALP